MGLGSVGVLPGAERNQQLASLVEGKVAVHHGREADMTDKRQTLTVGVVHIIRHGSVCGLQPLPDLLLGVAPQAVFQVACPLVVAGCNRTVRIVDQHGLDSGGTELDA